MKKFLLVNVWAILIGCGLLGCQENERVLYAEKPAVYFSSVTEEDSLFYSFASGLTDEDVVFIPVRIIGTSVDKDRSVSIEVDPESTAKKGVHYKDLGESVQLKAGSVETDIQVTVMNKELGNGDVKLILNLKPSEDFDLGYAGSLKAKLVITDQLVKPSYWDMPLSLYYGAYSKAKHRLCIQLQGFDFPKALDYSYISQYMSYGRMVYNYLVQTPIWDEDTQAWITADWSPL